MRILKSAILIIGIFSLLITLSLTEAVAEGSNSRQERLRALRARVAWNRNMRITSISAYDATDLTRGGFSIDVEKGVCEDDTEEPFHDTILGIKVVNESPYILRFDRFDYVVKRGKSDGRALRVVKMSPASIAEVQPNDEAVIYGLFLDMHDDGKRFVGQTDIITPDYGFKNVIVKFVGENSAHQKIRVRATTALSFDNFDNCDD